MSDIIDPTSEQFVKDMFGDKEVRWYQRAAINQTADALSRGVKRILIVLDTGTGKTLTIAAGMSDSCIRRALGVYCDRPLKVLFIAHKHRLLSQAEKTFISESNVDLMLQSSMSDINPEYIKKGWDVTIIDESHHEFCHSLNIKLDILGSKPIIGMTATPDRADGGLIKFEEIIQPLSREQAVAEGWLAPTHIHSFVDGSEKDKVPMLTDIINNYGHQMGQTMMFVNTKKQVTELEKVLSKLGYVATGILDQTSKQLDALLNNFSAGKVQFLITCNRISEGVDVVGCTDVVLGRQFGSYPMINQVIGRASRPDSDCNIWELINPLKNSNLDTTAVVGIPESHRLISKKKGNWVEQQFDYTSRASNKTIGIADGIRIRH